MANFAAERPIFFEGQYLGAEDLTALVKYFRTQDARQILGHHTWGMAIGLDLVEIKAPDETLEVYVQPGVAFDGYGRLIAMLTRTKLDAALLSGTDSGEVNVWIRYDGSQRQSVRKGFQDCSCDDAFSRVTESFALEFGARTSILSRQSGVVVNAETVQDARLALRQVDENGPLVCDASIPHQDFPDEGDSSIWLVPLGIVHWQAAAASFQELTSEQKSRSRRKRRYTGVIAENIYANDGVIRLHDRYTLYDASKDADSLCEENQIQATDLYFCEKEKDLKVRELIWLEGNVRTRGDLRLFDGRLEFRDDEGRDYIDRTIGGTTAAKITPLLVQRNDSNTGSDLQILIGKSDATTNNRLTVCQASVTGDDLCKLEIGATEQVVFQDDGKVGIGAVDSKLEVPLTIRGIGDNDDLVGFEDDNKQRRWQINLGPAKDSLNFVETDGDTSRLFLQTGGNVGIGTTNPGDKLEVFDASESGNGGITIHRGRYARLQIISDNYWSGIELRRDSAGEAGRPHIDFTNDLTTDYGIRISAPTNDDLTIEGGNVGIGTTNPGTNLHIHYHSRPQLRLSDNNGYWQFWGGNNLHIREANIDRFYVKKGGNIGIGTINPSEKLTVNGIIESETGGFKFPDGSIQTTALAENRWKTSGNDIYYDSGKVEIRIGSNETGLQITEPSGFGTLSIGGDDINCDEMLYLNYYSKWKVIIGSTGAEGLKVYGDLEVTGAKLFYSADLFINKYDDIVEQGDVIVLRRSAIENYTGADNNIPIPEIDLTETAYDQRVCGIVSEILIQRESEISNAEIKTQKPSSAKSLQKLHKKNDTGENQLQAFSTREIERMDKRKIKKGQIGKMVTLGCFSHCKVDADISPIEIGDLLTTSPTKGHAQKVIKPEKAVGTIIGKALGSLKKGKRKIPVMVMMQ
jgi:hypothetical protein